MKKRHKRVHYFEEIMDAKDFVEHALRPNDLFITVGAGDNWKLGRAVYNDLLEKAHV